MTLITIDEIERLLASNLPYSIERITEFLRASLKIYPELKEALLDGSEEIKKQARKLAAVLISRIDEEMRKARDALDLRQTTFEASLASYLTTQEMFLFQEARETILKNHKDFFPKLAPLTRKKPKMPILRC
jgi:hypothetical protein